MFEAKRQRISVQHVSSVGGRDACLSEKKRFKLVRSCWRTITWCRACSRLLFLVASSTWSLMSSNTGKITWLTISRQRFSPKWAWCSSRVFSKESRASFLTVSSFFAIKLVKLRRIGNQSSLRVLRRTASGVAGRLEPALLSADFSLEDPGTLC